jgi:OOP family OmpA-OmpF porin
MKRIPLYFIISLTALACKQPTKTTGTSNEITDSTTTVSQTTKTAAADTSSLFDINKVPVSAHDLGEFPYLKAPAGYAYGSYGNGMNKSDISEFSKEYFAVNGKLIPQEGKTCKTGIDLQQKDEKKFNSLTVGKSFDKDILALGGVQVNNVPVPMSEIKRIGDTELIDKHYGSSIDYNLLDDIKTYVIRTADKEVWIQFTLMNNESGKLTVLEKSTQPE